MSQMSFTDSSITLAHPFLDKATPTYIHTNGDVYYIGRIVNAYHLFKISGGVETIVYNLVYASVIDNINCAIAVPYDRDGIREVHFVLGSNIQFTGQIQNSGINVQFNLAGEYVSTAILANNTSLLITGATLNGFTDSTYLQTTFYNGELYYVHIEPTKNMYCQKYNPKTYLWETIVTMVNPFAPFNALTLLYHSIFGYNNFIYGMVSETGTSQFSMYKIDLATKLVKNIAISSVGTTTARICKTHVTTFVKGNIVYFLGGNNSGLDIIYTLTIPAVGEIDTGSFAGTSILNSIGYNRTCSAIDDGYGVTFFNYNGSSTRFTKRLDNIQNFRFTLNSDTSVTLLWDNNTDQSRYLVYEKIDQGDWASIGSTIVPSYTVNNLNLSLHEYSFKIKSVSEV